MTRLQGKRDAVIAAGAVDDRRDSTAPISTVTAKMFLYRLTLATA
jgi:hypothetical protein